MNAHLRWVSVYSNRLLPNPGILREIEAAVLIHPFLHTVDDTDEQPDAGRVARILVTGLLELAGDVGEAGVGAAFVSVEKHTVFGVVIDPKVPRRGLFLT